MDPPAGVTVFTACSINTGAAAAANSREDYNIYYNTGSDSTLFGRDSGNYTNLLSGHQTNLAAEGISSALKSLDNEQARWPKKDIEFLRAMANHIQTRQS